MSMVKYLFVMLSVIPTLSYAQESDGTTIFNCDSYSASSSVVGNNIRRHDSLNYDGTSRTIVSAETISRAKRTRLFLNHMDEFCSSRNAVEPERYMALVKQHVNASAQLIGSIYFMTGSARADHQNLAEIRTAISQYSPDDYTLLFVGSADTTGADSFNGWLSLNRAQYFSKGIAAKGFYQFILPLGAQGARKDSRDSDPRFRRADLYLIKTR